jgi:hypothetical protein
VGGGDPTLAGGHAASPTGPISPGDPGARGGPAPALVIGIVALVAVALAAGAFLLLRGDDDDTDRARRAAELSADADEPDRSGLGRFDDLEDLDVFEEFGGIGEEIGGGFGGPGGFDPDIAGSLAEIYQDAFGLTRPQAECLAEAFTSTFEDLDEDDALNSFGAVFELFDRCGISMADLGGFDPDG